MDALTYKDLKKRVERYETLQKEKDTYQMLRQQLFNKERDANCLEIYLSSTPGTKPIKKPFMMQAELGNVISEFFDSKIDECKKAIEDLE